MKHTWYNKNEDHKNVNDESSVEFKDGTLTLACNDGEKHFEYVGEPKLPTPEKLRKLEKWPATFWEQWFALEVAHLFAVKLV